MTGSLKTLQPNIHWHYKKQNAPGVLEITLLLASKELTFNCKANRYNPWMQDVVQIFSKEFPDG